MESVTLQSRFYSWSVGCGTTTGESIDMDYCAVDTVNIYTSGYNSGFTQVPLGSNIYSLSLALSVSNDYASGIAQDPYIYVQMLWPESLSSEGYATDGSSYGDTFNSYPSGVTYTADKSAVDIGRAVIVNKENFYASRATGAMSYSTTLYFTPPSPKVLFGVI